mgnify:FL=1
MKKIIVAVDSFKGSMTSLEAGNAIRNGIKDIHPDWNIEVYPVADGGEGTLEALTYHRSVTERTCTVTGPIGDHVEASYLWYERDSERIVVIEMAQAAGLPLVPIDKRNPLYTTTYGVGELIRDAIDQGCRKFIIGIGGSATNDAGIGMLQALGYHFYDRDGRDISFGAKELAKITDIGFEDVIRDLSSCRFQIACDVKNPFVGEQGCSRVYGHQKGATAIDVEKMDRSMAQFADLVERIAASGRKGIFPNGDRNTPGAGAAGGLGYAFLMFLDGVLRPGIDIILDEIRLEESIAQADLATAAYYGTDEKGESYQGYRVLAGLYTEACQIVVRKDSGIKSLDDLQGKTVSIGETESGTERNALQILQVSGLASPITETVNLTYIEAAEKLKSGEIDAMFYTGGVQTNVIAELADSCEIALIPVDAKTVDKLKLAYSSYETCEIPANTYNGQTEQVATVGVKALLLASEKMSDETAEELTRQLFAHATEIEYATSLKEIADVNAAVDGVQIPFHPGAKAYYASQGISVDAQEN